MAVKPIALRKLEKQSKNIYEAVVVMSKRARQINQDRYEEKVIDESDDLSELDVLDELPQIDPDEYEEKEKVTTEAMDQFLSGEVQWKDLEDNES
jgi:DNA-directed RNA polymerase subunit K/omega|tara:strand:+ start:62 stop:346 length:285 start_codon:yes stop_codon:yes gene_type:complete